MSEEDYNSDESINQESNSRNYYEKKSKKQKSHDRVYNKAELIEIDSKPNKNFRKLINSNLLLNKHSQRDHKPDIGEYTLNINEKSGFNSKKQRYNTNTVSTKNSVRHLRRRSVKHSVGKSRNKNKPSKCKQKLMIRTSQNMSKRRPMYVIPSHTITPVNYVVGGHSLESQPQTDEEIKMIKKIQSLNSALAQKEKYINKKLRQIKERTKSKNRQYKKLLKENMSNIEYLENQIQELKLNEEQLIEDLYNQQSLAKDAVRSLETLSRQFETEKQRIRKEAEKRLDEALKKERKIYARQISKNEDLENALIETEGKLKNSELQVRDMAQEMELMKGQINRYQDNYKLY